MKLYECDKGVKIYGLEPDGDKDGVIIFGHLDGAYSYCWVKDDEEKVVHLSASMEVEEYEDGYKPL